MRPFILLTLAISIASCSSSTPIVDVPLGKVVVYRNGVAYFERQARVVGKSLALSVPRAKVDDFLKSLTVRDKNTGKSLPVSFPSSSPGGAGVMIEMVITLPVEDGTEVVLSYITESPAWKPSYRVVMSDDGGVELEGWAIVDNTSGENWSDVVVGVGSSSALSFRYDLWSIRDVQRQALGGEQRFAVAPPNGSSPHPEREQPQVALEQLNDSEIINQRAPTIDATSTKAGTSIGQDYTQNVPTGRTFEAALGSAAGSSNDGSGTSFSGSSSIENSYVVDGVNTKGLTYGSNGKAKPESKKKREARIKEEKRIAREQAELLAEQQRNERKTEALAAKIKHQKEPALIEGWAQVGDKDAQANSELRANVVRNNLIDRGVPPALVIARGMGARDGVPAGVRVVRVKPSVASAAGAASGADAPPVGESHFGSDTAMTVQRGTSAMVSIVKKDTKGEVVYLYDSESDRGNDTFAFRAVRLINPTKSTLEAGPVTVYGNSRFIGEGLTDPIPPESVALVPFALDRQIVVERTKSRADEISSLVRLSRGVLTTEVDHSRITALSITNRMNKPVTVYVRHTAIDGWKLRDLPKDVERLGKAHLFPVRVGAKKTARLKIRESTLLQKLVDLRDDASLELLDAFFSDAKANQRAIEELKPLLALQREMHISVEKIDSLRERLDDYRVRVDELHGQIFSLKAVKSGGTLMRHLKTKMREISTRVQRSTIELVDTQEVLMISRVRFQDALAELTLAKLSGQTRTAKK